MRHPAVVPSTELLNLSAAGNFLGLTVWQMRGLRCQPSASSCQSWAYVLSAPFNFRPLVGTCGRFGAVMSATVTLDELDSITRQRVAEQIPEVAALTVATVEPLKISGSHAEREERAQRLANLFIGEMVPLLVQVRQDFFDKEPSETICGVTTFTEYCTGVLRYSESHVRRLIKGRNPASQKHDGSAHRKPPEQDEPDWKYRKLSRPE